MSTPTNQPTHRRRTTCRGCQGAGIEPFLDLGLQPLANALPRGPEDFAAEARYPLVVYLCPDCGLVQLADVIDPEVLFGHYLYLTGMSSTMDEHHRAYARAILDRTDARSGGLVVDIASNDGSLLLRVAELGARTLGVEPASNLAAVARERGVRTVQRFFDAAAARDLRAEHGAAACVVANNVLAHVDDPCGFVEGMAHLAGEDGRIAVEAPYLGHLLDRYEYDTVYHEHLSYFSVTALCGVFARAGVSIEAIEDVAVHGGTLRVWGRAARGGVAHAPGVLLRAESERAAGMSRPERYREFARGVAERRERLRSLLGGLRAQGARIAAYGAPAKGSTLLNYCGIGPETVEFTVDRSPLKAGRYLPGVHVPILAPAAIEERRPDHLLILPWNIAAEIVASQRAFAARGGRFVVPIPEPTIIAAEASA